MATIKSWTNGSYWRNYKVEWHRNDLPEGARLYTHPSPPEGMVGGWRPIETAPKGEIVLLWSEIKRGEPFIGDWAEYARYNHPQFTHWHPLPAAHSISGETK